MVQVFLDIRAIQGFRAIIPAVADSQVTQVRVVFQEKADFRATVGWGRQALAGLADSAVKDSAGSLESQATAVSLARVALAGLQVSPVIRVTPLVIRAFLVGVATTPAQVDSQVSQDVRATQDTRV